MRCVALTALAMLMVLASVTAQASVIINVIAQYPDSNLAPGVGFYLCGTAPLSWNDQLPMTKTAANTWSAAVKIPTALLNESQPTWAMSFKVQADSAWEMGMNHRVTVAWNAGSVTKTVYPYFQTYAGKEVTLSNVYSPQLNNTRDVWLYIPPAMVENPLFVAERVLIMHDGQNLQPLWNVSGHIDALIGQNEMEQVFVVGPYNTPDRIAEYTYSVDPPYGGGKGNQYLDFLEQTLIPLVAGQYQMLTGQENLDMGGSSLGGLITCYAGITRPKRYRSLICMSSSFWWNNGDFLATIIPQLNNQSATQRYYVDSGNSGVTDDDMTDTSAVSTAFLTSRKGFTLGQNFFWYLQPGGQHNEYWWSKRLHHPLLWLYGRPQVNNE